MGTQQEYYPLGDLDLEEASILFNVKIRTLRRLFREGRVPGAYKVGGEWRLRRDMVDKVREGESGYA